MPSCPTEWRSSIAGASEHRGHVPPVRGDKPRTWISTPRPLPATETSSKRRKFVPGQVHQVVELFVEARVALGAPHEPQLEDVVVTAALDRLVAGVVREIVLVRTLRTYVSQWYVRS